MKKEEILPLGSIVRLGNVVKKVIIIGRGLLIKNNNQEEYFDYAACLYPEGIIDDKLLYFNKEDISEVIKEGYRLEDESFVCDCIIKLYEENKDKRK